MNIVPVLPVIITRKSQKNLPEMNRRQVFSVFYSFSEAFNEA